MNRRKANKLAKRWTEERVRAVLAHYDRQTEDEVASEIDAASEKPRHAIVAVPVEIVPKVRKLVAKPGAGSGPCTQSRCLPRLRRACCLQPGRCSRRETGQSLHCRAGFLGVCLSVWRQSSTLT